MPTDDEVLEYHSKPRPGKIETVPTKPCLSRGDLSLACTPGGAKAVSPLLMGISKSFNVLQRGTDMENGVNVMAITVAQVQEYERKPYKSVSEPPLPGFEPVEQRW